MLPPSIAFTAGAGQYFTFSSVSGSVSCCSGGGTFNGPDGGIFASGTTDILSTGGISGIIHSSKTMFLVGVFTDGSVPGGAGPARLDVSTANSATVFTPLLNHTFFIGDGKNASLATQIFNAPATATRFYLGFADAFDFGAPASLPGFYHDNVGSLTAMAELSAVPEPSTYLVGAMLLIPAGLQGLRALRDRKQAA